MFRLLSQSGEDKIINLLSVAVEHLNRMATAAEQQAEASIRASNASRENSELHANLTREFHEQSKNGFTNG